MTEPADEALLLAGVEAAQAGQIGKAAFLWQQLIARNPSAELLTQAWFNLGLLLQSTGLGEDAEPCFRASLQADAGNMAAWENLAILLAMRGADDEAIGCFRELVAKHPTARHFFNLALLHSRTGRAEIAESAYRDALALEPDYAAAWTNLGLLLADRGALDEALVCQQRAFALAPQQAEILGNLGAVLEELGRLAEAEDALSKAIALTPDSALAHANLAVLHVEQGRLAEAETGLRHALAREDGHSTAALYLSNLLMMQGCYTEAWPLYEARFDKSEIPEMPFPRWQGEPLAGKSLLIWPEQGLGDEIQFCRYLPLLKARGAQRISLICRRALLPLMQTLEGVDALIPSDSLGQGVPPHDYWDFSLSVPLHGAFEALPSALPYLHASPEKIAQWSPRLPAGGVRVGLLWRGNPKHLNDAHRSLPDIECLASLWQVPGIRFISLQREVLAVSPAQEMLQFGEEIADFGDAAAIMAGLDLVISVDSAYAHLAGALGKPVWLLLPARHTDWRWQRQGEATAWYPEVMRLFRQPRRGDWNAVIDRLVEALRQFGQSSASGVRIA